MAFKAFDEKSKITWWQYVLMGLALFFIGYCFLGGDLANFVITIGWGPILVGFFKFFSKKPEKEAENK